MPSALPSGYLSDFPADAITICLEAFMTGSESEIEDEAGFTTDTTLWGDETCPVSTGGETRRVQSVRKGGGGGGRGARVTAARRAQRARRRKTAHDAGPASPRPCAVMGGGSVLPLSPPRRRPSRGTASLRGLRDAGPSEACRKPPPPSSLPY
jgi:hypothetical protein